MLSLGKTYAQFIKINIFYHFKMFAHFFRTLYINLGIQAHKRDISTSCLLFIFHFFALFMIEILNEIISNLECCCLNYSVSYLSDIMKRNLIQSMTTSCKIRFYSSKNSTKSFYVSNLNNFLKKGPHHLDALVFRRHLSSSGVNTCLNYERLMR